MIEIPTFKLLLVVYCFTGIHLFNYNVVEIKDFNYKHDYSNDSIEHYYCKDKYNIGDTIRHEYTIMVDSTSEEAIDYKRHVEFLEKTRLQEEAWAKDTVYQNKIKLEFQQKENEEAEIWLQEAAEKQMELEKLESKLIKKPE
jgi:hypothetical protein